MIIDRNSGNKEKQNEREKYMNEWKCKIRLEDRIETNMLKQERPKYFIKYRWC